MTTRTRLKELERRVTLLEGVAKLTPEGNVDHDRLTLTQTDLLNRMLRCMAHGETVNAIKHYRALTGNTLRDSKNAVLGEDVMADI